MSTYLFSDTDLAAQRLVMLQEVFGASSAAFLAAYGAPVSSTERPRIAADVGCGIGCTTRVIRNTIAPDLTLGIDLSAAFVRRAADANRDCAFVQANVAESLPIRSAHIIYARYVLAHMKDPLATLGIWLTTLVPAGRILIEENIDLTSAHPALAEYIETAGDVLRANGQDMYLGRILERWAPPPGFRVAGARKTTVLGGRAQTARMFSMNLPAWQDRAAQVRDPATVDRLALLLQEEAASGRQDPPTTWTLLQVAIERFRYRYR